MRISLRVLRELRVSITLRERCVRIPLRVSEKEPRQRDAGRVDLALASLREHPVPEGVVVAPHAVPPPAAVGQGRVFAVFAGAARGADGRLERLDAPCENSLPFELFVLVAVLVLLCDPPRAGTLGTGVAIRGEPGAGDRCEASGMVEGHAGGDGAARSESGEVDARRVDRRPAERGGAARDGEDQVGEKLRLRSEGFARPAVRNIVVGPVGRHRDEQRGGVRGLERRRADLRDAGGLAELFDEVRTLLAVAGQVDDERDGARADRRVGQEKKEGQALREGGVRPFRRLGVLGRGGGVHPADDLARRIVRGRRVAAEPERAEAVFGALGVEFGPGGVGLDPAAGARAGRAGEDETPAPFEPFGTKRGAVGRDEVGREARAGGGVAANRGAAQPPLAPGRVGLKAQVAEVPIRGLRAAERAAGIGHRVRAAPAADLLTKFGSMEERLVPIPLPVDLPVARSRNGGETVPWGGKTGERAGIAAKPWRSQIAKKEREHLVVRASAGREGARAPDQFQGFLAGASGLLRRGRTQQQAGAGGADHLVRGRILPHAAGDDAPQLGVRLVLQLRAIEAGAAGVEQIGHAGTPVTQIVGEQQQQLRVGVRTLGRGPEQRPRLVEAVEPVQREGALQGVGDGEPGRLGEKRVEFVRAEQDVRRHVRGPHLARTRRPGQFGPGGAKAEDLRLRPRARGVAAGLRRKRGARRLRNHGDAAERRAERHGLDAEALR